MTDSVVPHTVFLRSAGSRFSRFDPSRSVADAAVLWPIGSSGRRRAVGVGDVAAEPYEAPHV
jgi:hypothetical protein